MTSSRLSSRTAAGTLAGLMGASLLLPALTTKAASLEFDCYSRSTQELLVKAAYDMSNSGMACLKSSTAGTTETAPSEGPLTAEAPAADPSAEAPNDIADTAPDASVGETAEVTPPAESGRPRGIGEVIVGGIVNGLMDRLLDRLLPGASSDAGNAPMVDEVGMDAGVAEPGVIDAGVSIAEPQVDVAPQAQPQPQPGQAQKPSTSVRPIPKWDSMLGNPSIIPGLVKQAPKNLQPGWVPNNRPAPTPRPGVIRPLFGRLNSSGLGKSGATKPGLGKVNLGKVSAFTGTKTAFPNTNFGGLRLVR